MTDDTLRLYNANDGVHGRDGGPYLDQVLDRVAEQNRAFIENREPNFDSPPATAGTLLVTEGELLQAQARIQIDDFRTRPFRGKILTDPVAEVPLEVVAANEPAISAEEEAKVLSDPDFNIFTQFDNEADKGLTPPVDEEVSAKAAKTETKSKTDAAVTNPSEKKEEADTSKQKKDA